MSNQTRSHHPEMNHPRGVTAWPVRVAIVALAALASGCVNGVGWLPDSSGFVYTTSKGQLAVFDLKTKSSKVLVKDTGTNTYWPAVSPDGKRIAVAGLSFDGGKEGRLQVLIYDRQGREEHRSERLAWGRAKKGKPDRDCTMTQLFWSPDGTKLLVYGSTYRTYGTTGVYDLKNNRMTRWERAVPSTFRTTPARSDGKGFLLARLREDGEALQGLGFVSWDGKERPIRLKFDPNEEKEGAGAIFPVLVWPVLRRSRWDGAVAEVTVGTSRIRIDTAEGVGTLAESGKAEVMLGERLIWQQHAFPERGAVLSVLTPAKGKESYDEFTIVASGPKEKGLREIVPGGSNRLLGLFPAPDGKHAVVRVWEGDRKGPDADLLWLVDGRGQVVAKIDVNEE